MDGCETLAEHHLQLKASAAMRLPVKTESRQVKHCQIVRKFVMESVADNMHPELLSTAKEGTEADGASGDSGYGREPTFTQFQQITRTRHIKEVLWRVLLGRG